MFEFYLCYLIVIIGFIFGFIWNTKREKTSKIISIQDQMQLESIFQMDRDKMQSLGFN